MPEDIHGFPCSYSGNHFFFFSIKCLYHFLQVWSLPQNPSWAVWVGKERVWSMVIELCVSDLWVAYFIFAHIPFHWSELNYITILLTAREAGKYSLPMLLREIKWGLWNTHHISTSSASSRVKWQMHLLNVNLIYYS